jgi:hypothetical protein
VFSERNGEHLRAVVRVVYCSMNLFFERGVGNSSGADGPQNMACISFVGFIDC